MIGHLGAWAVALGVVVAAVVVGSRRAGDPAQVSGARRAPAARGGPRRRSSTPRAGVRAPRAVAWRGAAPPRAAVAEADEARWARSADLSRLVRAPGERGRLVLGELPGRGIGPRLVAAERAQSLAVIGPSQSGKTTALAVPAILRWDGPVVAASVKTDLVRETLEVRRSCGEVWCFDPAGTTGLPQSRWSPLLGASTWAGARRAAADLTAVTRADGTTADGEFWYATAAKLLAPLLFAAAVAGSGMHDVVRWVDTQETEEVADILHAAGVPEAIQAARATWLRDDRTRSAVYTTAETVLEPFAEPELVIDGPGGTAASRVASPLGAGASDTPPYGLPAVGATAPGGGPDRPRTIDAQRLLTGGHTLYVCAPAHDQRRLRAVFSALIEQVVHAAFARASLLGRPLDPPLLVVLDEAANIAPLRDLDGLAATCAGHGVQLVTVWQDLAQVRARFGERASTVVNNHRAKLFLPGIADPGTLDFASHLAGDRELTVSSTSIGSRGERTVTSSPQVRKLLPADSLRRLPPGNAVLLYGSLPPARLKLRPWFADADLRPDAPCRARSRQSLFRRGSAASRRDGRRRAALQSGP